MKDLIIKYGIKEIKLKKKTIRFSASLKFIFIKSTKVVHMKKKGSKKS